MWGETSLSLVLDECLELEDLLFSMWRGTTVMLLRGLVVGTMPLGIFPFRIIFKYFLWAVVKILSIDVTRFMEGSTLLFFL